MVGSSDIKNTHSRSGIVSSSNKNPAAAGFCVVGAYSTGWHARSTLRPLEMHSYRLPLTSNTPLESPGWRIIFLPVALAIEKQFKTELVIFPP